MYDDGNGVLEDDLEAVKWHLKAADQGYSPARSSLGVISDEGEGVPRDDAKAVAWYRKAAEQGYTLSHATSP